MRVLLVDDDEDTRALLMIALRRGGAEVVGEAANGVEGIELARGLKPDLVVLDLEMPVMGGLEALPELRIAAPSAQVVVVSNLPREAHVAPTAARGAVGYVEKSTPQSAIADEIMLAAGLMGAGQAAMANASRLPSDRRSAGAARRFLEETLSAPAQADVLETATLLVSEVVTNAVIHAGSVLDLRVWVEPQRLRVEVSDGATVAPTVQRKSAETTTGRGMFLVDVLADRWGTDVHDSGKTVWFELDRASG